MQFSSHRLGHCILRHYRRPLSERCKGQQLLKILLGLFGGFQSCAKHTSVAHMVCKDKDKARIQRVAALFAETLMGVQ